MEEFNIKLSKPIIARVKPFKVLEKSFTDTCSYNSSSVDYSIRVSFTHYIFTSSMKNTYCGKSIEITSISKRKDEVVKFWIGGRTYYFILDWLQMNNSLEMIKLLYG